ncbi:MAG: sigma factor-like helix-turn-helix DNA-binding protein [Dehalococcoidia bacterium]
MEQAEERRARIRGALYLGYSLTEIAQSLGISRQRVHQILRGHAACDRVINWLRHE